MNSSAGLEPSIESNVYHQSAPVVHVQGPSCILQTELVVQIDASIVDEDINLLLGSGDVVLQCFNAILVADVQLAVGHVFGGLVA